MANEKSKSPSPRVRKESQTGSRQDSSSECGPSLLSHGFLLSSVGTDRGRSREGTGLAGQLPAPGEAQNLRDILTPLKWEFTT